jgi:DNA-binding CsgD family transcriptional regulator
MGEQRTRVFGREHELAAVDAFIRGDPRVRAFVLMGGPGIGKTTVWEAGARSAQDFGLRVLSARASGAETQHSFATLVDLLEGVDSDELAGLPAPQLHALEVALLRAEPTGGAAEPHAVAIGFLNALRALAEHEPVLVALDDVQWLDPPSADALTFATRRLRSEPIAFLLTRRPGDPSELERALERGVLERNELVALSLGALRRLLSDRLGLRLPRRLLRQIAEVTAGNPLFALEVGRTLSERGLPELGEELPIPDAVDELLGTRVARLDPPLRKLLLAVALSADLGPAQLTAIGDRETLEDALDAGLLVLDGERVRPSHPLLAAAANKHAGTRERRHLHLELARVLTDDRLRAGHLALATTHPDAELASTVASAAAGAAARGARQQAVVLAEHGLRLTPVHRPERSERVLALAAYLKAAGEAQRVTALLTPELRTLPRSARVHAHLLLCEGGAIERIEDYEQHLELALAESEPGHPLRAVVISTKASHTVVDRVERIAEAEAWALEALPPARRAGPEVERHVLASLSWSRILRGRPIDDLCDRYRAVSSAAYFINDAPEVRAAARLGWRGEVKEARAALTALLALADERGEALSYATLRSMVCGLELRAGEWAAASALLDEWGESPQGPSMTPYKRHRALLAAGRGLREQAAEWATQALADAEATGTAWMMLLASRADGIVALLARDLRRAVERLGFVWEHTRREGVDDPGAFPVAAELVEALVELDELDAASEIAACLHDLAEEQRHPWGLATAKRCAAMVGIASTDGYEPAAAQLAEAAEAYGELGLRFDRACSLLVLGRAERRLRKWGAARRSLEAAAAAFDELGSPGCADEARSELARVGARRPAASGDLTGAERRVVELAADGLTNKEIAQVLFVGVKTVEKHLSHAYAKLGVRSRAQLTRSLSGRS